ncbi:MAG: tetratricopeptide repeat protein [Verrucomicrobia subdivision 3 bacterium]|nr:tetratricopeptide repeat protein [Limisphaerales bacterium]
MKRSLRLVLRWLCIVGISVGAAFALMALVERTNWYRARLVRLLHTGNARQQLHAATQLAQLKCERELLRALQAEANSVRDLGRKALEHIWFHAAGDKAYRVLHQIHDAMDKKEWQRALALSDRLTHQFPDFAEGWNRRAAVFWELGQYDKSIADSKRVLALNPHHYGAMQGIGVCRLQLGDVAEACRFLRAALQLIPYDEPTRSSLEKCEELLRVYPPPGKQRNLEDVI